MSAAAAPPPPPRPGKIVAIGLTSAAHAAQVGRTIATAPQAFFKAPSAVIGEGDAIVLPRQSAWVEQICSHTSPPP